MGARTRPPLPAHFLLTCLLALSAPSAWAQTSNGGVGLQPSQQQSQPPTPAAPPPPSTEEHVFGDWYGIRPTLLAHGIDLQFNYLTESAWNATGGEKQGVDYAHQIGLQADVDWQKLAGLSGFSTHLVLVQRAGRNLSSDYLGDHLLQVQEIYGGGGDVLVHLVYLYGEEALYGGRVDLAGGRMPVGTDYAASPLYCNYMSVSLCGNPHGTTANVGFTAWPAATWGGRLRVRPTPETYIQPGVFDVDPNFGGRSGFDWSTSGSTGQIYPLELGWEPVLGADRLPGHYKLGFAYDTSPYPDLLEDDATGTAAPVKTVGGRKTFYILADQMLFRHGQAADDGLIALGGYVHNDGQTSVFQDYGFAGLLDRGAIRSRPKDTIGVLFAYVQVSNQLGTTEQLLTGLGEPLTAQSATGVQSHELVFEANYGIHAAPGVSLMPDFQYIVRPNAQSTIADAAVFGLKTNVQF